MVRIKELRIEKNLTQKEIAVKLGLTAHNIGDWERGKAEPSAFWLTKLADFFGCSVDYLIGREDDFGVISNTNSEEEDLTELERELVDLFRELPEIRQETVLDSLRGMVALQKKKA